MSALSDVLERYTKGEATAAEVVAEVKTPHGKKIPRAELDDPYPSVIEGSWDEVSRAYFRDDLTDEQYAELYEAAH